jgi:pyruvate,water dikinase
MILVFSECGYKVKHLVGGKNASLGELFHISKELDFNIADGFAITTTFYMEFIKNNKIDQLIEPIINEINSDNIEELIMCSGKIKDLFNASIFTKKQINLIFDSYDNLISKYNHNIQVAVRSSAVCEDLPNASFAGQQDTYLNVGKNNLLDCIKNCFASLFNSRAISYRKTNNISFEDVKISVGVQKMVRSDIGSAGVSFSIDPETGYDKAIVINSAFGLGELVVSGGVKPDEFIVDKRTVGLNIQDPILSKQLGEKFTKIVYSKDGVKEIKTNKNEIIQFSLTNLQIKRLATHVRLLEERYSIIFKKKMGVDVEWALDGLDNKIYIIQTRPETVHSNKTNILKKYKLKERGKKIISGVAVGEKISSGKIKNLKDISEFKNFSKNDVLVTSMTTPDWEPIMKKSAGIITDKGGRTCHAAIVARELGINAIVGTTNGSQKLNDDDEVTICCAEGETGVVYDGKLDFEIEELEINTDKKLPVKLMLNVGSPELAFSASMIPNMGVGLARLEFIINNYIKVHPKALLDYPILEPILKNKIQTIMGVETDGRSFFINKLAKGIAKIASAFYPNDVIVRLSDFKSNEYKNLIGGEKYEPDEENPMIGWRGASRYYSHDYKDAFALECLALKYAREIMGFDNIIVMIPFCRTPEECEKVLNEMKLHGLERGKNKLKIYLMCEIPSNVIEADIFSQHVDGVSIGGNDLLQLTLGVDRDSDKISYLTNHENLSYRRMIQKAIETYKKYGVKVGFCGQQPSDSVEFCEFLVNSGIDSISVTSDSAIKTYQKLSNM